MNENEFIKRKELAIEEFKFVLNKYILPLFDIKGNLKFNDTPTYNKTLISVKSEKNHISEFLFYPCVSTKSMPSPFSFSIKVHSGIAVKKCATVILRELIKVTEYNCINFSKQRDYGRSYSREKAYKTRTLDLAFELGICKWLAKTEQDATVLHTLICKMIDWSSKTYEGKKVPFGIVIDFKKNAESEAADYLHFLENDSSAVFSDGIFSGILLDKNGKIVSFLTKETECSFPTETAKEIFAPFQFYDIAKFCVDSAVGIIALTNGEIIIVKNRSICFAKRGNKWISFDWNRVYSNLRPYFLLSQEISENEIEDKIKKLYCTLLDVSFAHTGGCISIVIPDEEANIGDVVKERIDLYLDDGSRGEISKESLEKIEILKYLLSQSPKHLRSFFEIEKPLRKEILSLDGATVVSLNGNFYCAGSIVAVGGGSSGGGRTAATKKLANYGIGIKISEDGYIEAFGKNLKESTPRMVQLFKFK